MGKWLLYITIFTSLFVYSENTLLERLASAKSGDFLVLESNQTITLLAIRAHKKNSFILEEITAPTSQKKSSTWAQWLKSRAPGHTSWSMVEIDTKEKQILECYSFSNGTWIAPRAENNFLATLLNLNLKKLAPNKLRKIGPPPQEGEPDRRKNWNPTLIIDKTKISSAVFEAFESTWPEDGSELANKNICLYFDKDNRTKFPCWIQIDTGHVTASLRMIDSGSNLPSSPYRSMPRRTPEFIGSTIKTKNGVRLTLKSPKYYKQFELFAVDVTNREKEIHLITHSLLEPEGEVLNIEIDAEELNQTLLPDHKYTWLIVPLGFSSAYSEMLRPFTWTQSP